MKLFNIIFILLLLTTTSLAEQMRIAIMDLQSGRGIEEEMAKDVADLIRGEMINLNMFTVLERAQMSKILEEQGRQLSGCMDTSCAVEIGQLLSANKIMVGKVSKFGTSFTINVRIVDVEKGVGEYAETIKAENENTIPDKIKELVDLLANRISGQNYVKPTLKSKSSQSQGMQIPQKALNVGITDDEWKDYNESGLTLDGYINDISSSHGIATTLSIIPLTSGHYHIGNIGWGYGGNKRLDLYNLL